MSRMTGIYAANSLREVKHQVEAVKNSKLPPEEKAAALRSWKRMMILTVTVVVTLTLLMIAGMIYGFSLGMEKGAGWIVGSGASFVVAVLLCTFLLRRLFRKGAWHEAYEKVDLGFDGLSAEEVEKLLPDGLDRKAMTWCGVKETLWILLLLAALIPACWSLIVAKSKLIFGVGVAAAVVCYFFADANQVERHRLKSGYYKKGAGYVCRKCGGTVEFPFADADRADGLQRDERGNRVMPCSCCGNRVPLIGLDTHLKDYRKYLARRSKG